MHTKYIFITGGVISSLGKGLTAASIGSLLEHQGLKIAMLKLDPYLNVDPGTMSPFEHGEVYVTDDGTETDLDIGHYYRFTNSPLSKYSNVTSGQIYQHIIERERAGDFLGTTIQVIPHITDEIKRRITFISSTIECDVVICEIGGTVGDIESLPFLEALRQFTQEHRRDCITIHLTYVPYIQAAGEIKTKPTQHSLQTLRGIGIVPDLLICRSQSALNEETKNKISLLCGIARDTIFDEPDVSSTIYEIPVLLHNQQLDTTIVSLLGLDSSITSITPPTAWNQFINAVRNPTTHLTIALVGKYIEHDDAYKSVYEAVQHAAAHHAYHITLKKIVADTLTQDNVAEKLSDVDGVIVPGGFGERGFEGKITAARFCREHAIPYLGLCWGLHALLVEYARHVCNLSSAHTTEIDIHTPYPVISLLEEQQHITTKGGTMRRGAYQCAIAPHTKAHAAYQQTHVSERHRHRYEFNNHYRKLLEAHGIVFSGVYQQDNLCEIAELKDHPWMMGVQFHPELQSKPTHAHPLFINFVHAAYTHHETTIHRDYDAHLDRTQQKRI